MTSETSPGSTPARFIASAIATLPRVEAASVLRPPEKAPTGVRAALAITMSVMVDLPLSHGPRAGPFGVNLSTRRV